MVDWRTQFPPPLKLNGITFEAVVSVDHHATVEDNADVVNGLVSRTPEGLVIPQTTPTL